MARSHVATFRGHSPRAVVAGRVLAQSAAVAAALMAATAIAALAGRADAVTHSAIRSGAIRSGAIQPGESTLALTVTSAGDGYLRTGGTITIRGMVRNLTGSAMKGLSVGMWSSTTALESTTEVTDFTAGTNPLTMQAVPGIQPFRVPSLAAHASKPWAVQVSAKALGLSCFGVYPLLAQVSDGSGAPLASFAVPLPFWPQSPRSCQASPRPRPADISWIWPLIDSPHQGPCQGVLIDNALATRIQPGGRLGDLLAAAIRYDKDVSLTFAVDPALLDSLTLMSQPYQVGSSASCGHTTQYPASTGAVAWLRNAKRVTAGHVLFVTPYADVDIAALIRHGNEPQLDMDLNRAASDGEQIAHEVLGRDAPAPLPAAGNRLAAVAWPAGGIASGTVLEYLAAELKIKTVILAPPIASAPYPPGAMTKERTGAGQVVNVLLADDSLSGLLRSRSVQSHQPAVTFGVSQLFLAETAVDVAANPSVQRTIVVTPPRRWSPSQPLADHLLADTTAPWLKPENIGQLSKPASPGAAGGVLQSRPGAELSGPLLTKVNALDGKVGLLESIFFPSSDPTLRHAVFGIESSRWRSRGGLKRAQAALTRTSQYVTEQFERLSLGGNRYVTLGGKSGSVIVSVRNGLSYPISVQLRVAVTNIDGSVTVKIPLPRLISVPPGKVAEKKLSVNATQAGSALLHFSLVSPDGMVLPHGRLTMKVQASDFGRIALIICAAALAVYVLASAARAIRHGRPAAPATGGATSPPALPDGSDEAAVLAGRGTVPAGGRPRTPDGPEPPDSVMTDQPELTPAGQVAADPRADSPGHGPVEDDGP